MYRLQATEYGISSNTMLKAIVKESNLYERFSM